MRKDPARFAAEVRGGRLEPWQEADMRAAPAHEISTWLWTRQAGKSLVAAYLMLWLLFRAPQQPVLVASGSGDVGAKRLLRTVREVAAGSPLLSGSVLDESGHVLAISTGSEARAIPTNEAAARGWAANAVIADEAQSLPPEFLLSALLPTLAAREGAFALLCGTAGRTDGPYYDLWRRAEIGAPGMYFARRVSRLVGGAQSMPWQSPSMMAQLERSLGPVRADCELRCIPATGGDYLFSASEVDAITADYREDSLGGSWGPAGAGGGLDLGVRRDRSAFVALGRLVLDVDRPVFAVSCAHVWPAAFPLMAPDGRRGVFEELAASPAVLQWLRVDETAMQGGFLQYLWPLMRSRPAAMGGGAPPPRSVLVNPFDGTPDPYATALRRARRRAAQPATTLAGVTFSSAMKQAAYGSLRALVERQQLLIPSSATELRQELLTLRVGLSRSGSETFDAESGVFDDLPDALVLALRPYRRRDGQWRTQVGDLAGTVVPWPAAWSGAETVVTGAGLRLLATPVWASLVGHVARHLTVPDGLHEQDPATERARQEEQARRERVWAFVNERQEVAHGG